MGAATAAAVVVDTVKVDVDGREDNVGVVVRCNVAVVAAVAGAAASDETEPASTERRSFLRGGWSSEEAPVAAAFLIFLSILRFFP